MVRVFFDTKLRFLKIWCHFHDQYQSTIFKIATLLYRLHFLLLAELLYFFVPLNFSLAFPKDQGKAFWYRCFFIDLGEAFYRGAFLNFWRPRAHFYHLYFQFFTFTHLVSFFLRSRFKLTIKIVVTTPPVTLFNQKSKSW